MSARYRIDRCTVCFVSHLQIVDLADGSSDAVETVSAGFALVAQSEAIRMAGNDWALWTLADGRFAVQRQGSSSVAKFRSWGEVASFLKALQDAGRAPLVQSC